MTYVCVYCSKPVTQDYEPETFPCCGEVGHTMPEDEYEAMWAQNDQPQERSNAEI